MKRMLWMFCLVLCISALAGCQKRNKNTTDEVGNEVEKNPLSSDIEETKDNNEIIVDDKNDKKVDDNVNVSDVTNEYVFETTIENPEILFNEIELSPSYKSIGYHNPVMTQRFGADPFAMVYMDRVYVYMTNDTQQLTYDSEGNALENNYGKIKSLNIISSDDLVNWTDHGTINVGKPNGASWWANNSWAPAATHKEIDGKDQFFIYFANSAGGIGVLRGDTPIGPFKDPIGKALITKETENCSNVLWLFDPAVLVDDDGRAYLYFGGGVPDGQEEMPNTARAVELGPDMISLAGAPIVIEAPYIFEDSGINKIGDTYYYSYCSNWDSRENAVGPYVPGTAEIIYMTSKNPLGPWDYQGSILQNPGRIFGSWGNNHHSMIRFYDKYYMFYHTQLLQDDMKIKGGYRSTHVDEVTVNEDGSINTIKMSRFGVEQVVNLDPYQVIEAETMAWMGGITTRKLEDTNDNLGPVNNVITDLQSGNWIGLSNVDFGDAAPTKFEAEVASARAGNVIRITVDAVEGKCLGYLEVPNTNSVDEFVKVSTEITGVTGVHKLFFTFYGEDFQFDNWTFHR